MHLCNNCDTLEKQSLWMNDTTVRAKQLSFCTWGCNTRLWSWMSYEAFQENYYTSEVWLQIYIPIKIYLLFQALYNKDIFVKNKIWIWDNISLFMKYHSLNITVHIWLMCLVCEIQICLCCYKTPSSTSYFLKSDFWGHVYPTCYEVWGADTAVKTNNVVSWESSILSN
jgi:hypothetical protein